MHRTHHPIMYVLGLAGLVPFIACGLGAISRPDPQAEPWLLALVGYGAVILAFLGGVHWGFVLQPTTATAIAGERIPDRRSETARLVFGVAPSLIGWAALIAAVVLLPEVALAILVAGFTATVITEDRLRRRGLVPNGYMPLRWLLSTVVVALLVTVIVVRLTGGRILF